jgi:hypothetical protein
MRDEIGEDTERGSIDLTKFGIAKIDDIVGIVDNETFLITAGLDTVSASVEEDISTRDGSEINEVAKSDDKSMTFSILTAVFSL